MALTLLRPNADQLSRLSLKLSGMAGLVEQQLADAVTSFEKREMQLAQSVITIDTEVNEREREIETMVYTLLEAKRLPAKQLRQVITTLKISNDLERIGDLAKNIARRSLIVSREETTAMTSSVARMGRLAMRQITDVLNAMQAGNTEGAIAVWGGDMEIDELYNSIFSDILDVMMKDPSLVNACTHIVFVAKNLERVGDHATNIAEHVYYNLTGNNLEDDSQSEGAQVFMENKQPAE
jgi:phosphate transport system protein